MSTRRLILASLLCGIAILVAGGVKLFQTTAESNRVDAELLGVGNATVVAGLDVAVIDVSRNDLGTSITVTMGRTAATSGSQSSGTSSSDTSSSDTASTSEAPEDVVTGWRMLADGALTSPRDVNTADNAADVGATGTDCTALPTEGSVTCILDFGVANGTPTFIYSRDGSQAQWLAGT